MPLSLEQLREKLHDALLDRFGRDENQQARFWIRETFPGYIVAQNPEGKLFQIDYAVGEDEAISFGEPREVEVIYVPVAEAAHFDAKAEPEDDGWTWPVVAMEAGWARGVLEDAGGRYAVPHYFPPEVVAQVAQAVNGARFRRRHPEQGDGADQPDLVAGWVSDGKFAARAALAKVNLLKNETELRAKLQAAREAGKLDLFGVSVLGYFAFKAGKVEGKDALVAQKLGKIVGLDWCAEAGAGGRFLQVAASASTLAEIAALQKQATKSSTANSGENPGGPQGAGRKSTGGAPMKDRILKVLEALRKFEPGRATEYMTELGSLAEDKHPEFLLKVTEAAAAAVEAAKGDSTKAAGEASAVLVQAREALAEAQKIHSANLIERKLGEAKLPKPAEALVREHLAGRVVDEARVDAEVKRVREAFAAYAQVGRVSGSGIEVGRESLDKVQLAMDAMLGVKEALKDTQVKPFRGIREAYIFCTGDRDLSFGRGGFYRVSEAIASADFPNILLNSMTKRLIQDYAALGMGGLEQLFTRGRLDDYKTQDRVRMGYLGDLATVAEAAAYLEITKPTDEKISYAPAKRGGLLTISEETIRNDDLGKIAEFPGRLARAGRRTLKQFITDFFINNPAFDPDAVAWFHATHSNLGSVALSAAELDAREILILKQTEKDSSKRLGLPLNWLQVPVDLKATAYQINQNNEGTNSWFQRFGVQNERIIVNELLTDANDWYYGSMPENAPFLEIGFLDGVEEPQIFLASLPTVGTQFTNDQIQYKVKMVFGGDIIDFRPVGKNVVA